MPNEYYNVTFDFQPFTKAKSAQVDAENAGIEAGFDLLPTVRQLHDARANFGVGGGSVNAHTVTYSASPRTVYEEGMSIKWKAAFSNSGAVTVNVDGIGAKPLRNQANLDFNSGDVPVGMIVTATYDSTADSGSGVFKADSLTEVTVNPSIIDDVQISGVLTWSSSKIDGDYYNKTVLDAGQLDTRYYTETEMDAGQMDSRYYTEAEVDANFYDSTELDAGQLDNRYYTETEVDANFYDATELDSGQLDNRYYTETELLTSGVLDVRYFTETELLTGGVLDNVYVSKEIYTASGAISIGDAVALTGNDTISTISAIYGAGSVGTKLEYAAGNDDEPMFVAHDAANNRVILAYGKSATLNLIACTVDGASLTALGPTLTVDTSIDAEHSVTIAVCGNDQYLVTWVDGGIGEIMLVDLDTSTNTFSNTDQTTNNSVGNLSAIAWDSTNNVGLWATHQSNTTIGLLAVSISGGTTISVGAEVNVSIGGTNAHGCRVVFDPDNDAYIVGYMHDNSTTEDFGWIRASITGSTVTAGTAQNSGVDRTYNNSSIADDQVKGTYDQTNKQCVFTLGGVSGTIHCYLIDATTANGAMDAELLNIEDLGGASVLAASSYSSHDIEYDPGLGGLILTLGNDSNFGYPEVRLLTSDGTTLTHQVTTVIENEDQDVGFMRLAYDSVNGRMIVARNSGAGAGPNDMNSVIVASVTDTRDNFIGFAAENIADTNTGAVATLGLTDKNQAGLKQGETYFLDPNGAPVLFDTGFIAGYATNTTDIIVGSTGSQDARFYTKNELETGSLDSRYYTETEVDATIANKVGYETYTASGAISAGDAVAMNANDTVEVISAAYAAGAVYADTVFSTGGSDEPMFAYFDSSNSRVILACGISSTISIKAGTVTDNSVLNVGPPLAIDSGTESAHPIMIVGVGGNEYVISYMDNGLNEWELVSLDTATNTFTTQDNYTAGSTVSNLCGVGWNGTNGILVYQNNALSNISVQGFSISGSAFVTGSIDSETITITSPYGCRVIYDSVNDAFIIGYMRDNGATEEFAWHKCTLSGSVPTLQPQQVSGTDRNFSLSNDGVKGCFDAGNVQCVFVAGSSTTLHGYAIDASTTNGTMDAEILNVEDLGATSQIVIGQNVDITYDANLAGYVLVMENPDNFNYPEARLITSDGTTWTEEIVQVIETVSQASGYMRVAYDSVNNQVLVFQTQSAVGSYAFPVEVATLTDNRDKFIGFAPAAIADTQTGFINTQGQTNTQQSSLTQGTKYYLDPNGSTVTNDTGYVAGYATSATELIVGYHPTEPAGAGAAANDEKFGRVFTADTTLAAGQAAAIKTNGNVEPVATTLAGGAVVASRATSNLNTTYLSQIAFNAAGDQLIVVTNNGSQTKATAHSVVGGLTGAAGAEIIVDSGSPSYLGAAEFGSGYYLVTAIVAGALTTYLVKANGTSLSVVDSDATAGSQANNCAVAYDGAGKCAVAWVITASDLVYIKIFEHTGDTLNAGSTDSAFITNQTNTEGLDIVWNSTDSKFVCGFLSDIGSWWNMHAISATVSGSVPTIGEVNATVGIQLSTSQTGVVRGCYDPDNNLSLFVVFANSGSWGYSAWDSTASTVSQTGSGTWNGLASGTPVTYFGGVDYDTANNTVVIIYEDSANFNYSVSETFTLGADGILTQQHQINIREVASSPGDLVWDTDSNTFHGLVQEDAGDDFVIDFDANSATSTNATEFIGFAESAISAASTGTINMPGSVNDMQSGLTPGTDYWVDIDGTLNTTDTNQVRAGRALSATEILVGYPETEPEAPAAPTDEAGTRTMTASGAINAGDPVVITTTTNTVAVVGPNYTAGSKGSNTVMDTSAGNAYCDCAYEADQNVLVAVYLDNANLEVVASTVTGTTIGSPGTAVQISTTAETLVRPKITAMDATYLAVVWVDNGATDQMKVTLISVSGTTITNHNTYNFGTTGAFTVDVAWDGVLGDLLCVGSNTTTMYAWPFSRSGTTLAAGTSATDSAPVALRFCAVAYDTVNSKFVIGFADDIGPEELGFQNAVMSGSSVTLQTRVMAGTDLNYGTLQSQNGDMCFDPDNGYMVLVIADSSSGCEEWAVFDPASTTGAIVYEQSDMINGFGNSVDSISLVYDETLNLVVAVYDDSNNFGYCTTSGISVTASALTIEQTMDLIAIANTFHNGVTYDADNGQTLAVSNDSTATATIKGIAFSAATLGTTANDWIGFAAEAIGDGGTGLINLNGIVDDNQSGLTVGSHYWIDTGTTLSASDTGYPKAGIALTATEILIGV